MIDCRWLAAMLLCATSAVGAANKATAIRAIETTGSGDAVEVQIVGDGPLVWRSMTLADPPRLVLDFPGVRNGVAAKSIPATGGAVRKVRVSLFRTAPLTTRVVLDLATSAASNVRLDGDRVRIRFGEAPAMASASSAPAPAEPPAAVIRPLSEPDRSHFRHVLYDLSYTQADRVLAALKALGYSTIEFKAAAGDSAYDQYYTPIAESGSKLPLVVKLIDAPKTSLMDRDPGAQPLTPQQVQAAQSATATGRRQAVPDIGGTYLHQATSGEPQERLLIVYDTRDPEPMERLLATIREELDVAARQVVIAALVLEINTDRARELGLQFSAGNGRNEVTFNQNDAGQVPFTWVFDKAAEKTAFVFSTRIQALIDRGEAEVLSNPSVLVLDGRQARIQIGKQVPVVNSTATAAGITSSVEYFPVGIVLNLRPRINDDGSEVTMQVETIVSAVAQSATPVNSVLFAPTVDNRQVQTFVRVADNTPFIIGGLISSDSQTRHSGLPGLSRIPVIGSLFGHMSTSRTKREVIVVLTPHVVPQNDRSFSYVIPKDSDHFDSFGRSLFRSAYRIRSTDVYDLQFVYESEILRNLVRSVEARAAAEPALRHEEPYAALLAGHIPGEEILVRRMLWDIVKKSGLGEKIDPKRIIVFQPSASDPEGTDFEVAFLDAKLAQMNAAQNAMLISFNASSAGTPEHPFVQPKGEVTYLHLEPRDFEKQLIAANARTPDGKPLHWSILLSDAYSGSTTPLDMLRNVLVLKRVLALNASLPLTIREFSVGRQIIFPSEEDVARSVHVVDRDAARLFYECKEYYRAFEQEFNATTRSMVERVGPARPTP